MEYTFIDYSKKKKYQQDMYRFLENLLQPRRQVTAGNTTIYFFWPEEFNV